MINYSYTKFYAITAYAKRGCKLVALNFMKPNISIVRFTEKSITLFYHSEENEQVNDATKAIKLFSADTKKKHKIYRYGN